MRSANLSALAGFSPSDVLLLSGYWPVMGSSVALLTCEGRLCVVLPEDEVDLAHATTDAELIPYKPASLTSLMSFCGALKPPAQALSSRISLSAGTVGTSLDDGLQGTPYQSVNRFRADITGFLKDAFPTTPVRAVDSLLEQLKGVRTSTELAALRHVASLAKVGFDAAPHAIAAGRREDEVAADIESAFARVANQGVERGRGFFFCMSGPNSAKAAGAFARTRRRVLETGDFVMIHTNTVGDGVWTDITRTYVVGEPSDQQRRMSAAVLEAREASLATVCPGTRASAVDTAARDVLTRHGFGPQFKHAVGHGVGYAATDPDAHPRMHPNSPDILSPGSTFNIEPAIYFDGIGGTRHCDVVACTQSGADVLTSF